MGCLAFIALPFVGLYRFLRWGFTNGPKGYITVVVVFVAVLVCILVVRSVFLGGDDQVDTVPVPDRLTAPFLVETFSRVYYAEQAVQHDDGTVTMVNYWDHQGGTWVLVQDTFHLDEFYGTIKVTRR